MEDVTAPHTKVTEEILGEAEKLTCWKLQVDFPEPGSLSCSLGRDRPRLKKEISRRVLGAKGCTDRLRLSILIPDYISRTSACRIPTERLLAASGHRARMPHSLRAWNPKQIAVQMPGGSCILQGAPSTSVLLLRPHGVTMPWDSCFSILTHDGEGKAQPEATKSFSITEVGRYFSLEKAFLWPIPLPSGSP